MGEFKSQLKTLLKKNLLLKSKSRLGIFCEILFPIVIVLIIFAILILVQAFKPNYNIENVTQFSNLINKDYKIIYGSNGGSLNEKQRGVMNIMKLQLSETLNLNLTDIENDYFLEINDKETMEIYFLNNSNNVFGGIWFDNDIDSPSTPFKYNIRLDSDRVLDNEKVKVKNQDSKDYLKKNFGFIQVAMDQAIFGYYNLTSKLMVFGQRYPDPYVKLWQKFINGRDSVFKSSGSVFVTAGLMIFGFRLVTELVVEKETKIREAMKMMGLDDIAYFLSWIITSLVIGLPVDLIIVIILKGSQLIYSTSWVVVMAIMVLYLLTLLLLAFIFSMFFDKSKFAGLITFLLVLVINICGIFVGNNEFSTHIKLFLCLLSPIAFASSFYTMAVRDLKDILTVNWHYLLTEQQVIGMLVFDIIFYTLLIWYLDKIVKTEFGTKEPWYFLFTKKYWFNGTMARNQPVVMDGTDIESTYPNEDVEMIPIDIRNKTTISIRNLRKEYNTGDGLRVAVNDLYLDMFDGQIHGFLGPNGSGKSTTIGMLTGLIQPTSGTAFILGNDITYQMSKIRNKTGVCLQTDIIWSQLTVLEHLMIYASLKGITNSKEIKKEAKKMAIEVDLGEKLNAPAGSLSGGQKRKLCLGIAFIGRSDIIFLDEPTSGMDPLSRRVVWDFLLKYKKSKTIILTTHYLEEADYLCDRISIISFGKLITDGSSLYLKNKYGVGYLLTCSKYLTSIESLFNVDQVTEFIKQYIPDATILSNAGSEISYRLPTSSLSRFADFFAEFDSKLKSFYIETYGISVTTLEEVFLKIGSDAASSTSIIDDGGPDSEELKHSIAVSSAGINPRQQLKGLLIKRLKTSSKDMKSFLLSLLLPIIVIIGSIIVYKQVDSPVIFYNNSTQPLIISLNQYGSKDSVPIQIQTDSSESNFNNLFSSSPFFNQFIYLQSNLNFEKYLIDYYKLSTGAINFKTMPSTTSSLISYNVFYNFDYVHSWPIHVNLINDALLRNHTNGTIGIQVTSMPFNHILTNFEIASQNLNVQSIVYFVVIMMSGFSLMAGSFGGNISQERTNRIKRLLYISGCKKYIYWLSNLIWDYFFSFIILTITTIIISSVDQKFRDQIGIFILSLFLFSLSIVPLSYLFSYKFSSFGKSTGAITAIHIAIGVIFTIIMINLKIQVIIKKLENLQNISDIVDVIFNIISPLYAFSRILFLVSDFPGSQRLGSVKIDNYWSMNYGGVPLIILGCHVLVWNIWIIFLDYTPEFKGYLRNPKTIVAPFPPTDEDSDVTDERNRIEILPTKEVLQFKGLHKLFIGKGKNPEKIAVYNNTLGIPKGQTFGLLGMNGAGKTTTLSMLAGDILPTSGEITINGFDLITERAQALNGISSCPQHDALITLLSAREQLWLYCRIKGVPEEKIKQVVEAFIKMMDLGKIANSSTGGYSGGNKRKTSLSIAMLGNPSIVYLDEPSTGCDPIVRRFQWNIINELGRDKVIIITSHSMAEVQALCSRLTILKNGQFLCLGSVQHVKSKFGTGYSIDVKFKKEHFQGGTESVLSSFPNAKILDAHDLMASFELPNPIDNPIKVSQIFSILLNDLSPILEDYSVCQTSLDQIYIKLTGSSFEDRIALNDQ